MNTELPDAAVQKMTAQIGEALFGQPGLDLIEIANRCVAERSRFGFEPILHASIFDACSDELNHLRADMSQIAGCLPGVYYMDPPDGGNVSIPEQVRRMAEDAAQHRRAVQPSPAGQEDALVTDAMVEAAHAAYWAHPDDSGEDRPCIRAALEAALAARQPVGQEPVAWQGKGNCPGVIGQWHYISEDEYRHNIEHPIAGYEVRALYAAPPAQAVDLGQFREAVEHWGRDLLSDHLGGYLGGKAWDEASAKLARLRALIDSSKAVQS